MNSTSFRVPHVYEIVYLLLTELRKWHGIVKEFKGFEKEFSMLSNFVFIKFLKWYIYYFIISSGIWNSFFMHYKKYKIHNWEQNLHMSSCLKSLFFLYFNLLQCTLIFIIKTIGNILLLTNYNIYNVSCRFFNISEWNSKFLLVYQYH